MKIIALFRCFFFSLMMVLAMQWSGCAEIKIGRTTVSNMKSGVRDSILDIVMIGDSIARGVGGTSPIDFYVANHYPEGLTYVNTGIGGNNFGDVVARFDDDAINLNPRIIFVHCGTNDIVHGRTWAQVEADLNTIDQKCLTAGIPVFFAQILPRDATNQNDATVAAWNVNFAAWCTSHSRTLLICHDVMEDPQNDERPHPDYFNDFLHPNGTGNSVLGDAYYNSYSYER